MEVAFAYKNDDGFHITVDTATVGILITHLEAAIKTAIQNGNYDEAGRHIAARRKLIQLLEPDLDILKD